MKKTGALLVLIAGVLLARGQGIIHNPGIVSFVNTETIASGVASHLATNADGTLLVGTNFMAELFQVNPDTTLTPIPSSLSPFRSSPTTQPGTWNGPPAAVNIPTGGGVDVFDDGSGETGDGSGTGPGYYPVTLLVRVWDSGPDGSVDYASATTKGSSGSFVYTQRFTRSPADIQMSTQPGFQLNGPTAPSIIQQPQNQSVILGSTVQLAVGAQSLTSMTFQWWFNSAPLADGARILGATSNLLTITNAQIADAGNYSVVVANSGGMVTSAVAMVTVLPCLPAPSGLVDWWRGEANALDSAGTNNGTLINGAGFAPGLVGQAFSFDGVDDYVEVPNSPSLNPTDAITVEAWYMPTAVFVGDGDNSIVDKGYYSHVNPYYQYHLGVIGDYSPAYAFRFSFDVTAGGNNVSIYTPPGFWSLGNWYHVVGTYDGSSVSLYVDGAFIVSSPATGAMADYGRNLRIGAFSNLGSSADYTPGLIDEVSIWNRALTPNEVSAIYTAGSAGKCIPVPLSPPIRLYVGVAGGGSVSRSPDQAVYLPGDVVMLTTTNGRYYRFLAWSDGNTNSARTVTIGATNIFTAVFTNTVPLETLSFKQWDRSFGGVAADNYPVVRSTPDGGCVLAGATASDIGGNKTTPTCGAVAAWVVKLDAAGNKQWEQTIGAPDSSRFINTIELTGDGGYVLGGSSTGGVSVVTDNCGKTSLNFGGYDFWLVRLDASGQRIWDTSYGGSGTDALSAIAVLDDGGFVLAGVSDSPVSGNKTSPNFGGRDFWVVRTDASGNKVWDRSFGGTDGDAALAVAVTVDGGFLVSGGSSADVGGNKTAPHYGLQDFWVVRLDASGNKLWDQSYGGSSDDNGAWLTPMPDGGAVLAGYTDSPMNSGTRTAPNRGGSDYWVVRIDADGNQLWDRSFGGSGFNGAYNVKAAADGGVIVVGESDSGADGNKITAQFGNSDGWVVRLDAYGEKVSELSLGGTDYDYIWSADTAGADAFILAGGSFSDPGGNKTAPHWGDEDVWVIKLAERSAPVGTPVVLVNGEFHPDNSASATNSALIQITSSFPGSKIYYTLNGAPPASGVLYTGLFVLTQPALVRAVAFNASGLLSAEADPVEVDVAIPPFIVTPPEGRTVGTGMDVNLNVLAGGTLPLSYQWTLDGLAVPGATGPALPLLNIQPNQGGSYAVVITNAFGAVTSVPVLVVVFAPPSISAQPASASVGLGGNVTFSISALGPPPLQYQWRKNGANITDATNSTLTITNVQFDDGGSYTVIVASPGGALVSDPAVLTVTVPSPPAGDNFASTNTLVGANGAATGTNNFATREPGEPLHAGKPGSNSVWYTWTAPAKGIATFRTTGSTFDTLLAIYTGVNVASLTTVVSDEDSGGFLASEASFNASSGATYHIAIDGFNGQQGAYVLRWELLETADIVPEIICPPASLTVQPGQDATFSVSASGPSLAYQWVFNGADIPGATQASYARASVTREDVGLYSVRVRSTAAQGVESAPAILEIGPEPGVQSQDKPGDAAASCPGGFRLRAAANAAGGSSAAMGSIGYQVLVSSSTNNLIDCNTANCGGIPVGTRFLELQPTAAGTFILDTMGSASRTKIWVCRAGTNNLDLTRSYLTCDVDSAPDGRSLVLFQAEAGRAYQVWISRLDNTNGVLQLNWKLGLPPRIVSLSPDLFTPQGASMTLSVAATNVVDAGVTHALSAPGYSWYFNGTALLATGPNLALTDIKPSDAGQYFVVAGNEVGATSAVVHVEVFGAAERAVVNSGGFTELFADATTASCSGAPARYQWRLNGAALTGETNRNLYLRGAQPAQAGQYSVIVSNCFGTITYPAATVAVTVDVGFTAALPGNGQVVLQWRTTPGKHYRVEQRQSMDSIGWTALQPDLTATSSSLTVTDPIGAGSRFYRIVSLD